MKKLLLAGLLSVGVLFAYNPLKGVKAQKPAGCFKDCKESFCGCKNCKKMDKRRDKNY